MNAEEKEQRRKKIWEIFWINISEILESSDMLMMENSEIRDFELAKLEKEE